MEFRFVNYINLSKVEHETLLNIRNLDYVRLEGKDTQIITIEKHLQWVNLLVTNTEKLYYAVFVDKKIVGGINLFNIQKGNAYWGLFFKPNISPLVPSLSAFLLFEKAFNEMKLENLHLEVKCNNINAHKFDLNFGFSIIEQLIINGHQYHRMSQRRDEWQITKEKPVVSFVVKKLQDITYQYIELRKQ